MAKKLLKIAGVLVLLVAALWVGDVKVFQNTELYRDLNPLGYRNMIMLYWLPESFFTPQDAVIWFQTQGVRGDFHRAAKVVGNPQAFLGHPNEPAKLTLDPGTWRITWSSVTPNSRVADFEAANVMDIDRGVEWLDHEHDRLDLVHTPQGWRVTRVQVISHGGTKLGSPGS